MLRIPNLKVPLGYTHASLQKILLQKLRIGADQLETWNIARRSIDARDKNDVHFVITIDACIRQEEEFLRKLKKTDITQVTPRSLPAVPPVSFRKRPVVVGAGPSGLFAAYILAQAGARPILIERGHAVEQRVRDVEAMRQRGELDPESNVQFGEGGAGTFSDGKLTTGIKSPWQRYVLETFVRHGAPDDILYEQKPHIGTDLLRGVVVSMREKIKSLGGEVHFSTCLTGLIIREEKLCGVTVRRDGIEQEYQTDTVLLATGHSARDTIQKLYDQGIVMQQKPFAIGARIEHPQSMIDASQYGRAAGHPALGPAVYKLAVRTPDGRGAYTFCMCPGGEVMAASSEPGRLCVNGMSCRARDAINANSALLVGVRPEDFGGEHPLAGMQLQRSIEETAFRCGGGDYRAPVQRVEDLLADRPSKRIGDILPSYRPGYTPADLRECLPDFIIEDMKLGIRQMDRQLHGFMNPDAILTGVETRSSSPVRIPRSVNMMASLDGLFPVGEGAGYAGGIVSAAVDGIEAAYAALERGKQL